MYYRGDNDWWDYQSLQHWKYLRKEKVNGKWRYYYEDKKEDKLTRKSMGKFTLETDPTVIDPFTGEKRKLGAKTSYYLDPGEGVDNIKEVDKETYDATSTKTQLYVGKTLLKDLAKEQIAMGLSFVKDFFSGKVTFKKKLVTSYPGDVSRPENKDYYKYMNADRDKKNPFKQYKNNPLPKIKRK